MIENSKSDIEKEKLFNDMEFNNKANESSFGIIAQQSDSVYKKTLFYTEDLTTLNAIHIAKSDTPYLAHLDSDTLRMLDEINKTASGLHGEDLI